jgi:hypothetical protein
VNFWPYLARFPMLGRMYDLPPTNNTLVSRVSLHEQVFGVW